MFLSIKDKLPLAEYLDIIKEPKHRIALSKLRLSSHRFPIESGRYEQVARQDRICPFGCQKIGDESHYMFECRHPFMKKARAKFQDILNIGKDFEEGPQSYTNGGDCISKLLRLTSPQIIVKLGKLAFKLQEIFKDFTY